MNSILVIWLAAITGFFPTDASMEALTKTREVPFATRGPIAWYPLNGDAKDHSGHNKHGILMNGTGFGTNAAGQPNRAAYFDGKDDWINIPDKNNYFSPSQLTVSFFFNLRDVNTRSAMLSKSAWATPSAVSWSAGVSHPQDPYFSIALSGGSNSCSMEWGQGQTYIQKISSPLKNNRWYHAVFIFIKGIRLVYLNGQLVAADRNNNNQLLQCGNADLRIGAWWAEDIVSIEGKLDDIRIYNFALSQSEINYLGGHVE